jgi:hypothetical protein
MFWCAADPFLRRTRLDPYEAWKRRFDRAQRGRKGRLGGRGQEERRSLFQAVASPAPTHTHAGTLYEAYRMYSAVRCCTVPLLLCYQVKVTVADQGTLLRAPRLGKRAGAGSVSVSLTHGRTMRGEGGEGKRRRREESRWCCCGLLCKSLC